ncbi:hypothetical protein [Saliphagus sp. LR7]|uniref:hypothetical protein n=1 Tax=Saliphagus sp. LR7 TaxID=2282654 RepID=UPI000DF85D41|nr:hypothetical protein [Saliphagus sp. LR7]
MVEVTRSTRRSAFVRILTFFARPCYPAGVIAGFAAIASWVTYVSAKTAGDAAVADTFAYVAFWFGALSVLMLGFAMFVATLALTEDLAQQIWARHGWRWS